MLLKSKVIEMVNTFEDEFSIDELFEKISFIEKVEEGLNDSKAGKTTPQNELNKEMQEWFK